MHGIVGDARLSCAVLENGIRVLTQSDMMRALGRSRQAKGRGFYDADVNLPAFLTAKNLKPFIPNELYVTSSQIEFRLPSCLASSIAWDSRGAIASVNPAKFQTETLPAI